MGIVDLKSGSTLTIRDLVPEDSGFYKCKGENFMGSDESEISLVVEEAEPEGDGYLLIIGKFRDFLEYSNRKIRRYSRGSCDNCNFHCCWSICEETSKRKPKKTRARKKCGQYSSSRWSSYLVLYCTTAYVQKLLSTPNFQ